MRRVVVQTPTRSQVAEVFPSVDKIQNKSRLDAIIINLLVGLAFVHESMSSPVAALAARSARSARTAEVAGHLGRIQVVAPGLVPPRPPPSRPPPLHASSQQYYLGASKHSTALQLTTWDRAHDVRLKPDAPIYQLIDLMEAHQLRIDLNLRLWPSYTRIPPNVAGRLSRLIARGGTSPAALRRNRLKLTALWYANQVIVPSNLFRHVVAYDSAHTILAIARLRTLVLSPQPPLRSFCSSSNFTRPSQSGRARARISRAVAAALAARGFHPDGRPLDGRRGSCKGSLVLRLGDTSAMACCGDVEAAELGTIIVDHMCENC